MKKIFLTAATAAMLVLILGISSCSSDTPPPANQKFVGSYLGSGVIGGNSVPNVGITITAGSSSTGILVNLGSGLICTATCSGSTFSIPSQNLTDNAGNAWVCNGGTGSLSGSTLTLGAQLTDSGGSMTSEAFTLTKN